MLDIKFIREKPRRRSGEHQKKVPGRQAPPGGPGPGPGRAEPGGHHRGQRPPGKAQFPEQAGGNAHEPGQKGPLQAGGGGGGEGPGEGQRRAPGGAGGPGRASWRRRSATSSSRSPTHRPLRAHRPRRQLQRGGERFGEAKVPDYPIPYHTEIMESFDGIDLDAAAGSPATVLHLMGDVARLHEAVLAYARGLHDRPGLHLLRTPLHDPRQRGGGRHEPDGHGRHDVQDRGGGPLLSSAPASTP